MHIFTPKPKRKPKVGVVLVDMQPIFMGRLAGEERDKILSTQIAIVRECKKRDIPIAILEVRDLWETIDNLARPLQSASCVEVFLKDHDDGFTNKRFHRTLKEWGVTSLIFMGLYASCCVLKTAKTAVRRGFDVYTGDRLIADNQCRADARKSRMWYTAHGVFSERGSTIEEIMLGA
jgi:nicotinamidase-related amidase